MRFPDIRLSARTSQNHRQFCGRQLKAFETLELLSEHLGALTILLGTNALDGSLLFCLFISGS